MHNLNFSTMTSCFELLPCDWLNCFLCYEAIKILPDEVNVSTPFSDETAWLEITVVYCMYCISYLCCLSVTITQDNHSNIFSSLFPLSFTLILDHGTKIKILFWIYTNKLYIINYIYILIFFFFLKVANFVFFSHLLFYFRHHLLSTPQCYPSAANLSCWVTLYAVILAFLSLFVPLFVFCFFCPFQTLFIQGEHFLPFPAP